MCEIILGLPSHIIHVLLVNNAHARVYGRRSKFTRPVVIRALETAWGHKNQAPMPQADVPREVLPSLFRKLYYLSLIHI